MTNVALDGSKVEYIFTVGTSKGIADTLAFDWVPYLRSWKSFVSNLIGQLLQMEKSYQCRELQHRSR